MLKYQANIASQHTTGMQRYTLTNNKHLTSLRAVELGSFVHVRDISNQEITGHAFSATVNFSVSGAFILTLIVKQNNGIYVGRKHISLLTVTETL